MNVGTTVTCPGTISEARRTRNSRSRPGNRSRANAYAASVLVTSTPSVTMSVILRLLSTKSPNGISSKTLPKWSNVTSRGSHSGGSANASFVGSTELRSIQ